jgi:alpha-1,2-mannosyltransferase
MLSISMALSPVVSPPSSGPVVPAPASAAPTPPRTGARRVLGTLAGVMALAASVALFLHFRPLGHAVLEYPDLNVYREAGRRLLDGRSLYASPPRTLPFTYPPFAAVLSVIFALPPRKVVMFGWFLTNIALLGWVLRTCFRPALDRVPGWTRPLALLSLTAVMFWLRPVNDTLDWGQINLLLLALVLADGLGRTRLPRGVLVGVAAALKLVPGIFVGYFLVTKQWRAAITAGVSAGVCILVAFALAPSSSWTYWTQTIFESGRIGDSRYYSNQSLLGIVQRTLDDPWAGPVWVALVLVVLGVGFRRVARAQRDGDVLAALAITGLMGCLVSPISWFHHFVWVLPALAVLVDDGRNRTRVLIAAGVALLVTTSLPYIGIHLVDRESPVAVIGWVLENSVGLLTLGLVFLLPHRRR